MLIIGHFEKTKPKKQWPLQSPIHNLFVYSLNQTIKGSIQSSTFLPTPSIFLCCTNQFVFLYLYQSPSFQESLSSTSPSIHPLSVYASIHTNTHSLSSVYKYLSAHPPYPFLVSSFFYQSIYISVIYAAILPFLHPSLFSTSTTTHLPLSLSLSPVEQVCNGTRDKNTPAFLTSTY